MGRRSLKTLEKSNMRWYLICILCKELHLSKDSYCVYF